MFGKSALERTILKSCFISCDDNLSISSIMMINFLFSFSKILPISFLIFETDSSKFSFRILITERMILHTIILKETISVIGDIHFERSFICLQIFGNNCGRLIPTKEKTIVIADQKESIDCFVGVNLIKFKYISNFFPNPFILSGPFNVA